VAWLLRCGGCGVAWQPQHGCYGVAAVATVVSWLLQHGSGGRGCHGMIFAVWCMQWLQPGHGGCGCGTGSNYDGLQMQGCQYVVVMVVMMMIRQVTVRYALFY